MGSNKFFDENSIVNRNKKYKLSEGTVILNEGEVNLDMYKIAQGHVEMYTGYGTDEEKLIGILGPGTCFGEFGVLTGMPAVYTIVAYSDVVLIRVNEALMEDFVTHNYEDIRKIMSNMAKAMLNMHRQVQEMSEELSAIKGKDKENGSDSIYKNNIRNYAIYRPTKKASEKTNENSGGGMRFL